MRVYAKAPPIVDANYITPNKEYLVVKDDGKLFRVADNEIGLCLWNGCAHLNGGQWKRIERPDKPRFIPAFLWAIRNAWHEAQRSGQ